MTLRLGSLCTGYGGLDMAVAQVLDVEPAWHAEVDPAASKVLAHHWPTVPNLGDVTAVDWKTVEPVDVMCFGFPCQDLSYAGRGAGITEGTRSGLWYACWDAVRVLRPRLVVVENVSALLTRRPGMDVVAADMAESGYEFSWRCVRASDVGACHRRERVFIVASRADALGQRLQKRPQLHRRPVEPRLEASRRDDVVRLGGPAADTLGASRRPGNTEPGDGPSTLGGRGTAQLGGRHSDDATADPDGEGLEGRGALRGGRGECSAGSGGLELLADPEVMCEQDQPFSGDPTRLHEQPVTGAGDRDRAGRAAEGVQELGRIAPVVAWGPYELAIRRHERALGRIAPAPSDGEGRLSPRFVEWMMMLPDGWVTAVPSIGRTAQLRMLGNGVVPAQGAAALRSLIPQTHLETREAV